MSACCILLFARPPAVEAQAKRMGGARRVFDLTRRRVAEAAASLPGVDLVVVGTAPGLGAVHRLPQRGRSFGERLRNAFADVRALGYDRIVAVPIDCPRLEARDLAEALAHLDEGRPTLGPSPDGGIYLLAPVGDPEPWLQGVDWCTPRVFRQLLAAAPDAVCLSARADLDGAADLIALLRDPHLDDEIGREVARLVGRLRRWPLPAPERAPRGVVSSLACRPPPLAA